MGDTRQIFSVKDLTRYIKDTFDFDEVLQNVWVRGELSNFVHHSRGHMYFTVKDEECRIKGVMFAGYNRYLKFVPKNGTRVLIRGSVSVYERDGQYQLYAKEMQPDGIGSLYMAYEQLKQKLETEGMFDAKHKKPLPLYPTKVGIITSPTGAAVRDIITTIRRRYPVAHVLLYPVEVQGEHAVPSICRAIDEMNKRHDIDVLIVGRGGGSIEELWAFNEEAVARSIFRSQIPIISAVGHETDFTIADFAADVRAATPTAAAELAVPHLQELHRQLETLKERMAVSLRYKVDRFRERLERVRNSYVLRQPDRRVMQCEQELDRLQERLVRAVRQYGMQKRAEWKEMHSRLLSRSPVAAAKRARERAESQWQRLQRVMQVLLREQTQRLDRQLARLDALSPLKVMRRGYSLVFKEDGRRLIKSVNEATTGEQVAVRLSDGVLQCKVEDKHKEDLS
ncbi:MULTISPECIES: exodeoxyribonuclease VII large subunit [Aneurinibacillus]|uniref:Exodeoxyribonuclease 7 large subunit n=1 Tax=Aneurinibacillus thermoaerophilus TaxID=143495 RepID=A0ABX8Y7U1_ANETH|nr:MULTISPECIES: exodeoxyribonuclease VII large subunit [Aneurinibacillus]AMA72520.1 exodeoxyribonuclease VII large subunit [Aneurinibacillus sp. XH2]MED0675591.1 exodeoxyribonuclease VII large subunit [Aneurinibacillus thermoaerophilus]MED0681298.1 exodeoxyribonuclease VII large subunit [Aneurinibacillus thermoaerophilus]MED0735492.1 exodeoxyribonuclease VII large subunit [Aneurinibacillus thermoaerophilus]MED0756624.1 exodeoxyribonuclease VII large subunit [Aneurinibacillus thermoaerophilus]